jgi:uncharacterized protein YndB with AHSA1/START domain
VLRDFFGIYGFAAAPLIGNGLSMNEPKITYVVHVATTTEKLWEALTSPEMLKKNWGRIESQWTKGSQIREIDDSGKILWKGDILRSEPPRLLSYTFGVADADEPPTEVTFELSPPVSPIAPGARIVQLRLTQSGFKEKSKVFTGCARAWPEILSSLKTYLETGCPLGFAWKH